MKEKKARVEDALHATRAAVEEGIVPGGGVALIRAKAAIAKLKGDNVDQEAGIKLVLRAVEAPLRSEEHTSELQSLMRISYAVFCLKKKKQKIKKHTITSNTKTIKGQYTTRK